MWQCEGCGQKLSRPPVGVFHCRCTIGDHPKPSTLTPLGKPGTELRAIIPKLFESKGCKCKDYAAKMDQWGVDGCERRFDSIVAHLVDQSKYLPVLAVEFVARRWLRQAINRAATNQATNDQRLVVAKECRAKSWAKCGLSFITSINPSPKRHSRQHDCLASWLRLGVDVVALQLTEEADTIRERFPDIEVVPTDGRSTKGTPLVYEMLRLADDRNGIVINSDIEVLQDQQKFLDTWEQTDQLKYGVRWNHAGPITNAQEEPWGIDAFRLPAGLINKIDDHGFGIGQPMWDWWLPVASQVAGVGLVSIREPVMFHELHPCGWTQEEHDQGVRLMGDKFGLGQYQVQAIITKSRAPRAVANGDR